MIFLPSIDIRAFEPHDKRHFEARFLDRGDDALGDHVAFHDPAENIHQNAFDLGVGGDDLERSATLSLVAPPPTSRKFAGSAAIKLDDVHRRHGKTGAIHHAADRAGERDII